MHVICHHERVVSPTSMQYTIGPLMQQNIMKLSRLKFEMWEKKPSELIYRAK